MRSLVVVFAILVIAGILIEHWWIAVVLIAALIAYIIMQIRKTTLHERALRNISVQGIDAMDGHEFEHYAAWLLKENGFNNVEVTPGSGDYGADVVAHRDGRKYVIQCKCYSGNVSNSAVQEIYAAKAHYGADEAVVMTNSQFTQAARTLAMSTGVSLWDREELARLMTQNRSGKMSLKNKMRYGIAGTHKRNHAMKEEGRDVSLYDANEPITIEQSHLMEINGRTIDMQRLLAASDNSKKRAVRRLVNQADINSKEAAVFVNRALRQEKD